MSRCCPNCNSTNTKSRQIVAFHIGDRSRVSAQAQKEVDTRKLQETCDFLYRWMASLRRCHSSKATSGRQEAKADNQSHRTIQLHVETKGISFGQKIALLFQETRQSYWCHQIFSLPLQSRKSITCIALPFFAYLPVRSYRPVPRSR